MSKMGVDRGSSLKGSAVYPKAWLAKYLTSPPPFLLTPNPWGLHKLLFLAR